MLLIDSSKWSLYASIAQVFATIFAGGTTLLAVCALWEVRKDRSLRARPHLLLDHGGFVVEVEHVTSLGIPGVNFAYGQQAIADAGMKVTSTWRAKRHWGRLINHGVGAAINAQITVVTRRVTRAGETFVIDDMKQRRCPYAPNLNTIPSSPTHIEPGKVGSFHRIPTLMVLDGDCAVSLAECEVLISYEDIFGKEFETRQSLIVTDMRAEQEPHLLFSIGDEADIH